MLGATFSCIVGEQFRRLRDGDRFYYSHQGVFKPAQMAEIKKVLNERLQTKSYLKKNSLSLCRHSLPFVITLGPHGVFA